MSNAIEAIKAACASQSVETIEAAILAMGGRAMPKHERMVRAGLIEVYAERKGTEAADAIMDRIGL